MAEAGDVFPLRIDLSAMVRRSVATLYSHLVTRPTGQALRLGIESQIGEVGGPCLSILDFRQVSIMDYSCADETVAKLLRRYGEDDAPEEVYFLARGVGERHLETIDAVLSRHGLALVADVDEEGMQLLGPVPEPERLAWRALESLARAHPGDVARALSIAEPDAARHLDALARRRVLMRRDDDGPAYLALSALLPPAAEA